MNFAEVKSIIIPQGNVKEIYNGTSHIYGEVLVRNPVLGISLSRGTYSNGSACIKVTYTLSGLSNSLITKWGIIYITKTSLGTKTLTMNTIGRTMSAVSSTSSDTVNGAERVYSFVPSTLSTILVFRSVVQYIGSNGTTKTVYSSPVTACYNDLT